MMFTSCCFSPLLRSICYYSSLVLQKEKGLSDLKFREEICLSVCVSLLKRSLCEDESQKDFEREEHWPLKISGKIFSEQNVAFLCFRDFWCTKGHLWECTTSCAPIYFFIFHFKALLILSLRRSDEESKK